MNLSSVDSWARAVSHLKLAKQHFNHFMEDMRCFKGVSKVLRDQRSGRNVKDLHKVIMRALSWGFSTSNVERTPPGIKCKVLACKLYCTFYG